MDSWLDSWQHLLGRIEGPFAFRLILQPIMATIFGIRAGLADGRVSRAPYLWSVVRDSEARRRLIRDGFKDIGRVVAFAIVMDTIYQYIVFHWFYPLQSLLIAVVLAIIPYAVVRGLVDRVVRQQRARSAR